MEQNIIKGLPETTNKIKLIVSADPKSGSAVTKVWTRKTETDAYEFLYQLLKKESVQKWIKDNGHSRYKKGTVTSFMMTKDPNDGSYMVNVFA